jgi:hypothetical protein
MTANTRTSPSNSDTTLTARKILEALHGLRFGSVEITVHEGRIVQIERKEKLRLNISCPEAADLDMAGAAR